MPSLCIFWTASCTIYGFCIGPCWLHVSSSYTLMMSLSSAMWLTLPPVDRLWHTSLACSRFALTRGWHYKNGDQSTERSSFGCEVWARWLREGRDGPITFWLSESCRVMMGCSNWSRHVQVDKLCTGRPCAVRHVMIGNYSRDKGVCLNAITVISVCWPVQLALHILKYLSCAWLFNEMVVNLQQNIYSINTKQLHNNYLKTHWFTV